MTTLAALHPAIQSAILRLTNSTLTFEQIGSTRGITKQAAEKQCKKGMAYLQAYQSNWDEAKKSACKKSCAECEKKNTLICHLQRRLILNGVVIQLLTFFKECVLKFMPQFRVVRLPASEKKQILDWLAKFKKFGGLVKDFAAEITSFNIKRDDLKGEASITKEHVKNNSDVRKLLVKRNIKPEELPAEEDIKKMERRISAETKKTLESTQKLKKTPKSSGKNS